jgi:hypothetical protein
MLSNSRQAEPSGQPEFTVLASGFWLLAPGSCVSTSRPLNLAAPVAAGETAGAKLLSSV